MSDLHLAKPRNLQEQSWHAIEAARRRLQRALDAEDRLQVVGCCKELAESVAKVVLAERGRTVAENAPYSGLVTEAHEALDRQPGRGLTSNLPLRQVAGGLKAMVTSLGELRNSFGTGHGRAYEPEVVEEMTAVCVDATLLWVRWALRRLEQQMYGALTPLIAGLDGGEIFRQGELADRLRAASLPALAEADQARLAVAVAQRAGRDTFNVRIEGVEACIAGDLLSWPSGYRKGLLDGLLLTREGTMALQPWMASALIDISAPMPDHGEVLAAALDRVADAPLSQVSSDWSALYGLHRSFALLTPPAGAATASWQRLVERLDPGPY